MKRFKIFFIVLAFIIALSSFSVCSLAEVDGQDEGNTSDTVQTVERSEDQTMLSNPVTGDLSAVFYALSVASAVFALGLIRVGRRKN